MGTLKSHTWQGNVSERWAGQNRIGVALDQRPLALVDGKIGVGARAIRVGMQLGLQVQRVVLQVELETGHRHPFAFVLAGSAVAR
jgi:hypothetical protein